MSRSTDESMLSSRSIAGRHCEVSWLGRYRARVDLSSNDLHWIRTRTRASERASEREGKRTWDANNLLLKCLRRNIRRIRHRCMLHDRRERERESLKKYQWERQRLINSRSSSSDKRQERAFRYALFLPLPFSISRSILLIVKSTLMFLACIGFLNMSLQSEMNMKSFFIVRPRTSLLVETNFNLFSNHHQCLDTICSVSHSPHPSPLEWFLHLLVQPCETVRDRSRLNWKWSRERERGDACLYVCVYTYLRRCIFTIGQRYLSSIKTVRSLSPCEVVRKKPTN